MTSWSPQTLARVDDTYDRENASDGHSRYGIYLSRRRDELTEFGPDPVDFAAAAWRIATPPVMEPGYVRLRPDLHAVQFHRDDEDGTLQADITVRLSSRDLADRITRALPYLGDWETEADDDQEHARRYEPRRISRGALLTTTRLILPCEDWKLDEPPTDAFNNSGELTAHAKQTVHRMAELLNQDAGKYVAALRGEGNAR